MSEVQPVQHLARFLRFDDSKEGQASASVSTGMSEIESWGTVSSVPFCSEV
jgi:hypothetical protein